MGPQISSNPATRQEQEDAFFAQDLSSFGTYLDGNRLAPEAWTIVPARATFGLADVNLFINFERLI